MEKSINELITKLKALEKEVEEKLEELKRRSEQVTRGELEDVISALEKKFNEKLKNLTNSSAGDSSKFAPFSDTEIKLYTA